MNKIGTILLAMLVVVIVLCIYGNVTSRDRQDAVEEPVVVEVEPDLYPVRVKDKWGFMNNEANILIKPQFQAVVTRLGFTYGTAFEEGLAAVMKDDKWGYIDRDGEFVIEPEYNAALPFENGL